jgi:acyl carrier protein
MGKLEETLAKSLGIPASTINDQTSPENTESWDSFTGLMMVSELESAFNVKFTMDEVTSVKNVADIKKVLKKHNLKF